MDITKNRVHAVKKFDENYMTFYSDDFDKEAALTKRTNVVDVPRVVKLFKTVTSEGPGPDPGPGAMVLEYVFAPAPQSMKQYPL